MKGKLEMVGSFGALPVVPSRWVGVDRGSWCSALGNNPSSAAPGWAPPTLTPQARLLPSTPTCPKGLSEQYSGVQSGWAWECFGQEPVCNYRALQGGAWHWRSCVLSEEYLLSESREKMALLLLLLLLPQALRLDS